MSSDVGHFGLIMLPPLADHAHASWTYMAPLLSHEIRLSAA